MLSRIFGLFVMLVVYNLVATGFLGLTVPVVATASLLACATFTALQFQRFMRWLF